MNKKLCLSFMGVGLSVVGALCLTNGLQTEDVNSLLVANVEAYCQDTPSSGGNGAIKDKTGSYTPSSGGQSTGSSYNITASASNPTAWTGSAGVSGTSSGSNTVIVNYICNIDSPGSWCTPATTIYTVTKSGNQANYVTYSGGNPTPSSYGHIDFKNPKKNWSK